MAARPAYSPCAPLQDKKQPGRHARARKGRLGAKCKTRGWRRRAWLGSPVRLEGDLVVARHLAEVLLQLPEELLVALGLLQRHKRVDVGKLPPGDRLRQSRERQLV